MKSSLETTNRSALVVSGASKRFGAVTALDNVSLELGPQEIMTLVGPSGCGKSTLLRTITGLIPLDTGEIVLDGELVDDGARHLPPERRRIGLVFQEHALFPHLTVAENIGFGIRKAPRREVSRRVGESMEMVALAGLGNRYPHELSGGERQRVALARALAPEPNLLLLDEPFGSLDPNLRGQLRNDVIHALRSTGAPAIVVTHDQLEALAIGDRVAVMRAGRIEHLDTPTVVFHRPVNRFVGTFMGEASFLPIDAQDGRAATVLGPVTEPVDAGDVAMVRPDDVVFHPAEQAEAEIVAAEFRGETWCYRIRYTNGTEVLSAASHLTALPVGTRGRAALTPGHRQIVVPTGA